LCWGAIPALIAVYLGSVLLARIAVRSAKRRGTFTSLLCYAFGVQFFSVMALMLIAILGHTRVAEQNLAPNILRVIVDALAAGWVFYLILVYSAVYRFTATILFLRVGGRREWFQMATAVVGVATISVATYWLGFLPSKFRAAATQVEKIGVELLGDPKVSGEKEPTVEISVLVRNPTKKAVVVPVGNGLTVKLRLTHDGTEIPKNSFHVGIANMRDAPMFVIRPHDAAWIRGSFFPDARDWQLIDADLANGGSVELRAT